MLIVWREEGDSFGGLLAKPPVLFVNPKLLISGSLANIVGNALSLLLFLKISILSRGSIPISSLNLDTVNSD